MSTYLFTLRTLGQSVMEIRGKPLHIGSRHVRHLLIYLCVVPGYHDRQMLASLLFPGYSADIARTYLRKAIQQLRQIRPSILLQAYKAGIQMDLSQPLFVDHTHFMACDTGDVASCREAIALYRGVFLAEETRETASKGWWNWVSDMRHITDQRLSLCYEKCVADSIAKHDIHRGWSLAEEWMRKAPGIDLPHQMAMELLMEDGRRSEAIHLFQVYEERRVTRYGRKPGEALYALVKRLHQLRPVAPRPEPVTSPVLQRRFLTVLTIQLILAEDADAEEEILRQLQYYRALAKIVATQCQAEVHINEEGGIELRLGPDAPMEDGPRRALWAAQQIGEKSPAGHAHSLVIHHGSAWVGTDGLLIGHFRSAICTLKEVIQKRQGVLLNAEAWEWLCAHEFPRCLGQPLESIAAYYWLPFTEGLWSSREISQDTPLHGRKRELDVLTQALDDLTAGSGGRVVWIHGEAGVGKTHLVRTFLNQISTSVTTVQYTCSAVNAGAFLYPIASLLQDIMGVRTESLARKIQAIHSLLDAADEKDPLVRSLWENWWSPKAETLHGGEFRDYQTLLFESIHRVLTCHLFTGRRVVVIEDLQWADAATLRWLYQYFQGMQQLSVLMLIITRDFMPTMIGVAQHEALLDLSPWDAGTARSYLRQLAHWHGDPVAEDALIARSRGIPFYLKILSGNPATSSEHLPTALQDALDIHIARGMKALDLLQVFAVVNDVVSVPLLLAVLPQRDQTACLYDLDQLVQQDLLQNISDGWQFRHDLLRDAVHSGIPDFVRRDLHARVASVLEQQGAEPSLLAWHYAAAGLEDQASRHTLHAAQKALSLGDYGQAQEFLTALGQAGHIHLEGRERLQMNALDFFVHKITQGYSSSTFNALKRFGDECFHQKHCGLFYLSYRYAQWCVAAACEGIGAALEVIRCMENESYEDVDPQLVVNLTTYMNGWSLFWMGDLRRAHYYLSASIRNWRGEWDVIVRAAALGESYHLSSIAYLGLTEFFMGRPEQGLKRSDNALITLASGRSHSQMFPLGMRLLGAYRLWDLYEIEKTARRMLEICATHDMPLWRLLAEAFLAWAQTWKGYKSVPWAIQRLKLLEQQMKPILGLAAILIFRLQLDLMASLRPSRKEAEAWHRYYRLLRQWQCFVLDVAFPLKSSTIIKSYLGTIKSARKSGHINE
ncbi:MAG: AAA family ATPase [Acidithiobacillus sp.]